MNINFYQAISLFPAAVPITTNRRETFILKIEFLSLSIKKLNSNYNSIIFLGISLNRWECLTLNFLAFKIDYFYNYQK